MPILIDTHVLIWAIGDPTKLTDAARQAITASDERLFVSAVTAFEYADLHARGRIPEAAQFAAVVTALDLTLLDTPGSLWRIAAMLPQYHGDPVDRMPIAHAIHADLTLIAADGDMRKYPVRTLW